jgi:hypothetical protein
VRGFLIRKWLFCAFAFLLVATNLAAIGVWRATHCTYAYDRVRSNLSSLDMKIQAFSIDTNQWPHNLRALVEDDGTPGWRGPYASANDLKDPWGGDVQYVVKDGGAPVLSERGRNKAMVIHAMDAALAP